MKAFDIGSTIEALQQFKNMVDAVEAVSPTAARLLLEQLCPEVEGHEPVLIVSRHYAGDGTECTFRVSLGSTLAYAMRFAPSLQSEVVAALESAAALARQEEAK